MKDVSCKCIIDKCGNFRKYIKFKDDPMSNCPNYVGYVACRNKHLIKRIKK